LPVSHLASQAGTQAVDPKGHVRGACADFLDRCVDGEVQRAEASPRFLEAGVQDRGGEP